jgi:hypothetical protein
MELFIVMGIAFVLAMVLLARVLRRKESEGDWDKEGHGGPAHPEPGAHYRPLEVPPTEPFD